MANFGTVTVSGVEYTLTGEADFTNRQLPGTNYNDAEEGETYDVEFSAPGVDAEGNAVTVYWIHEFVKGSEPEDLSDLGWDVADSIEE